MTHRSAALRRTGAALLAALLLGAGLWGCGSTQRQVIDTLDERTGVTVTRGTDPMLFFRDNSGEAAYARDYVTLAPLAVNRMGDYRYFLWLGIWSTVAKRDPTAVRDSFESIAVYADGEPLALDITGWTADSVGISEPAFVRPAPSAIDAYYEVTLDQIRLLGEAGAIRIVTGSPAMASYEPWSRSPSATAGLRAFIDSVVY